MDELLLQINVQPATSSVASMLFSNHRIFLDVKDYTEVDQLEASIRQFGGVIENFLSKEITCVVTNRTKTESSLLQKDMSMPASTLRQSFRPSALDSQVMSRGLNLLMHSNSVRYMPVCDPVAFAEMWGIRIVALDTVVQAIDRQLQAYSPSSLPIAKESNDSHCIIMNERKFIGAFVKAEDTECNFRPLFRQFLTFPYLSLEGDLSNGIFKCDDHVQPVVIRKNLCFPASTRKQKAGSRRGYCECCDTTYDDLNQHLTGTDHQSFAEHVENFANLDKLIDIICPSGGTNVSLPAEDCCTQYIVSKSQIMRSTEYAEVRSGSYNDASAATVESASDHSVCLNENQSSGQCNKPEQCILRNKVKT